MLPFANSVVFIYNINFSIHCAIAPAIITSIAAKTIANDAATHDDITVATTNANVTVWCRPGTSRYSSSAAINVRARHDAGTGIDAYVTATNRTTTANFIATTRDASNASFETKPETAADIDAVATTTATNAASFITATDDGIAAIPIYSKVERSAFTVGNVSVNFL